MKGLYIRFESHSISKNDGIEKKIKAQMQAFNDAGLDCHEYVLPICRGFLYSLKWRLPFFNVSPVWSYDPVFEKIDYIYMRRPFVMNKYMLKALEKIRKKNPGIKILIEIPTYPYDAEYNDFKFCGIAKKTDIRYRMLMKKYIDHFVTVTNDDELFGVKTLKIKNGIDFSKFEVKQYQEEENEEIHICAVAQFKYWHGYERFIKGLYNYYQNGGSRKVICDFVGEGAESQYYKELVKEYRLSRYIRFHGFLDGDALLDIYNKSTIALGSLGCYKKSIYYSCDLKSRESLARGIPMVIGCKTEGFEKEHYKYFCEFPNDSSTLDINRIIEFHDSIYNNESGQEVTRSIRAYAEKTINTNSCIQSVVEYLSAKNKVE